MPTGDGAVRFLLAVDMRLKTGSKRDDYRRPTTILYQPCTERDQHYSVFFSRASIEYFPYKAQAKKYQRYRVLRLRSVEPHDDGRANGCRPNHQQRRALRNFCPEFISLALLDPAMILVSDMDQARSVETTDDADERLLLGGRNHRNLSRRSEWWLHVTVQCTRPGGAPSFAPEIRR
jgi:hypothetical protein